MHFYQTERVALFIDGANLYASGTWKLEISLTQHGDTTELRFVLIGLTLAMMYFGSGRGWFNDWSGFDLFVGAAGALLIVLFIKQTLVTARRLDLMERPREQ